MIELATGVHLPAAEYRRIVAAVGWRTPDLDDGALYATIWDIIVVPEAQRRGVGAAILQRLVERSEDRRIVALVATSAGRGLYERLGFAPHDGGGTGMFLRPSR